jgi:hypothetical protein
MVDPEMSSNHSALQIIKDLVPVCSASVKTVYDKELLSWTDPYILVALGKKLSQLQEAENLSCMHAIACGVNIDFFVIRFNEVDRFFYNCSYASLSEKSGCVEYVSYEKKEEGTKCAFLTNRAMKIAVCGYEVVNEANPYTQPVEMVLEGQFAVLFQQCVDLQNQVFVTDIGFQIEAH